MKSTDISPLLTSSQSCLIGECLESHPDGEGRYRIAFLEVDGQSHREWLTALGGVAVGPGEQVLLLWPDNWPDPIIVGTLSDSQAQADSPTRITLKDDEKLEVTSRDGQILVEITASAQGPVIRIGSEDVQLKLPGKFDIAAESIHLGAKSGDVRIDAVQEVIVQGTTIRLN